MNPELDLLSTKNGTNKITKQAEDESDVPFQVGHNVSTDGTKIIKNSQQSEDIFQQVVNSSDEESSMKKALRMGEILRAIFAHIPTKILLHSCSLVSKAWNAEARTVVRDHRICTFHTNEDETDTACVTLPKLNQVCEEITGNFRVIPFSRFVINTEEPDCTDLAAQSPPHHRDDFLRKNSNSNNRIRLTNKLKLRYLEIFGTDCPDHEPISKLLEDNMCHCESLRIEHTETICNLKLTADGWHPRFPQLEYFSIGGLSFRNSEAEAQDGLRWLLRDAPNLKTIQVPDMRLLHIVPQELLSFVELEEKLIAVGFGSDDVERVFGKMAQTKPNVAVNILIMDPRPRPEDALRSFNLQLGQILQHNHQSLTRIDIHGPYPLPWLGNSTLSNVTELSVRNGVSEELEELWDAISGINFEEVMPRLQHVKVAVSSIWQNGPRGDYSSAWPVVASNNPVIQCCTSVRKLTLNLKIEKINLWPFQALFPNVSDLNLHVNGHEWSDPTTDFGPLREIWKCWPQLEELRFCGAKNTLNRNYDLDLCGIDQEELTLLKGKGEKYLEKVHIVPLRPCLLTMSKLHKLCFEDESYWSWDFFVQPPGEPQTFISKVMLRFVLSRMPDLDITLPKSCTDSAWGGALV